MEKFKVDVHLFTGTVLTEEVEAETLKDVYTEVLVLYVDESSELLSDTYPMRIIPKRNIEHIEVSKIDK